MEKEYELKFHIYDGNEREIKPYLDSYDGIREEQREEGSVMSRVISYFFEGLTELLQGDIEFWENNRAKAREHYVQAERMFTRFRNSRNVQARLDYLNDRYISRVKGLVKIIEGLQINDRKMKDKLFQDALQHFNEEVSLTNKMEETMSSYAAFARASFTESQFLLNSAKLISDEDTGEAKIKLMDARGAIRQAAFIDPRYLFALSEIEDALDNLTKERILIKAEEFGDKATLKSENGDYKDAREDFRYASLFYQRASSLAFDTSSRRYLLSSATIYEASELEAEGNQLFRRENETGKAADKFEDAAKHVDKAIALMGRFGSDVLENNFTSQRDYYRAMSLQAKAITLFDDENYLEAKEVFEESLKLFDHSISSAELGENDVIITMSNEAKADIKGYLSMCEAMI